MPSLSADKANRAPAHREADPLFRREMRERWRRPLTTLQLALFTILLAVIALAFYLSIVPQGAVQLDESLTGSGRLFFRSIARLNALAWIPAGLLLAAPTLAAERERGHLADWILAGLTPRGIVRAKFVALAGFVLVMASVPFPIFALCFPLGGVTPDEFAGAMILTIAVAISSTAIGLLISAGAPRVTSALGTALLMSTCFLPVGLGFTTALLEGPSGGIFVWAVFCALVPTFCFRAACTLFEISVQSDLDGNPEAKLAPATKLGEIKEELRELTHEIAPPRPQLPANFGEPDAPLGDLESALVWAASGNAIARREVMAHLRKPRKDWSDGSLQTQRWLDFFVLWGTLGALGLALKFFWPPSAPYQWFGGIVGLATMAGAALAGAPGFVRERAKRLLSSLQLTALSPGEIVAGKALAALLICAQFCAGPLLSVSLMALSYGPRSALMTPLLVVASAALCAAGALTLSLWGRKTEVIAGGALALIAALWVGLPQLYIAQSSYFRAPKWLQLLWIGPLQTFGNPAGDADLALALGQLAIECALGALALAALCAWQLKRTRAEDENNGLLQRDLSRSWR